MKFQRISIENFGSFPRRDLDFSGAPLAVIYGPNEAGKTTALNAIRQAVFGFRSRTPYLTGRTITASVAATMTDGSQLVFTRRKGRPDQVNGTHGSLELNETRLSHLLGDVDLDCYEQMFGFSQEELRLGQQTLKDAKLTEALAGGTFGGIQALEGLRNDLSENLQALYKSRGSTSSINVLLREIEEANQKLKSLEIPASVIEDIQRQIASREEERGAVVSKLELARKTRAQCQRQLKSLPVLQKIIAIRSFLEEIEIPAGVDRNFVSQWKEQADHREKLAQALENDRRELIKIEEALGAAGFNRNLLPFESKIEHLGHEAKEIHQHRTQLSGLAEEFESAKAALHKHTAALGAATATDDLLQFRPSDEEKDELSSISIEYLNLEKSKIEYSSKLKALHENGLSDGEQTTLDYPPGITQLAEHLTSLERAEQQIEQRTAELQRQVENPEFVELRERVAQPNLIRTRFDDTLARHWQIPSIEKVHSLVERVHSLDAHDQELGRAIEQLQIQLDGLNAGTDQSNDSKAAEIRLRLEDAIQRRDALVQHWQDELSQPLMAASITPEQQSERLDELQGILLTTDELHQSLLDSADSLAASMVRQKTLQEYQEQRAKIELERNEIEQKRKGLIAEWEELWTRTPVRPADYDSTLEWTKQFHAWKKIARRIAESRRELHVSKQSLKAQREQIVDQWPEIIRETTPLTELRSTLQTWLERKRDEERNRRQREKVLQQANLLSEKLKSVHERSQVLESEFQQWLEVSPISNVCSITSVEKRLSSLAALQSEHATLQSIERKMAESRRRISQFEEQACDLQTKLAEMESTPTTGQKSQPEGSPERLAVQWLAELNQLREDRDSRIRQQTQVTHLQRRIQENEIELAGLEKRLANLVAGLGNDAGSDLQDLMKRLALADEKRLELASLRAELNGIHGIGTGNCKHEDRDDHESFGDIDEASLRESELQSNTEVKNEEERLQAIDESIGQLRERLEQIACNGQAQQARQQLQQKRSQLQELSEQWIQTKLAQQLLDRSIKLFASENEPAILVAAKQYLSLLTSGKYVDIEHNKDEKSNFTVRDARGVETPPDRLSTGTREQLYLAIRFAFIECYGREHEPLPVIMDDCFVNFDDERTRQCLTTVTNWGRETQTLILSCHRRIPEMIAEISPSTPVINLDQGLTLPAREFTERLRAAATPL